MTAEQEGLAQEADRLLRDETLNRALDEMRKDAVEHLVKTPAEQIPRIIEFQSLIGAIDGLRGQGGQLKRYILAAGTPQKARGGQV